MGEGLQRAKAAASPLGRCCAFVSRGRAGAGECVRNASITRDGRAYCAQHDPVAEKARRDASYAAYSAKIGAKVSRQIRLAAEAKAYRELAAELAELADGTVSPTDLIAIVSKYAAQVHKECKG